MNSSPMANTGPSTTGTDRTARTILAVCIVVALVYANSISNGFVNDDHFIIEIRHEDLDFRTVLAVFTSVDNLLENQPTPYYRPLNRLTYIVDRHFFGLDPHGYHAVNIMLHLFCVVLIYVMLVRLGCGEFSSLIAAFLFGVHPLNSEAVNFISGRNTILSTIFSLCAVLAFLKAEDRPRYSRYFISGLFFFLGLLSKETALMVIPLLIFLKWYRSDIRPCLRDMMHWDVTFLLFPVLFLAAYMLLRSFAMDNAYIQDHISGAEMRLHTIAYIIPSYFKLFFLPFPLTFHHEVPKDLAASTIPLGVTWILLGITVFFLIRYRSRAIVLGLAWLAINFIPISTIIPIPSASMAERYLYLPLIGAFAIVGDLFQRLRMRAGPGGTTALLLSLILPFSILTASRNRDWKDNLSMNRSMIEVDPGYWLGHFEYGYESYLRGDRLTAAREFQITLEIARHSYYRAWSRYYLGALDLDLGQREKALDHFRAASRADPLNPAIHYAIASLLKAENDGLNAYREFLRTAALSLASLHLLSEVNNETSQPRVEQTTSAANMFPRPPSLSDAWKSYFHFASGAEQSYDPKDMQVLGGRRVVRTRHVLTKTDRQAYALRLIRYPLDNAREARFTFDIACEQNLYKMTYMEFRDEVGMILASGYPERESPVLHEYLMPGTPMRELADTVCTDRS